MRIDSHSKVTNFFFILFLWLPRFAFGGYSGVSRDKYLCYRKYFTPLSKIFISCSP